jgi:hypothetical protein
LASPNIVIILVGNKKDLDADREVTFLEASRFAQENGMQLNYSLTLFIVTAVNNLLSRKNEDDRILRGHDHGYKLSWQSKY